MFLKAKTYQEQQQWELADKGYRQFLQQVPNSAAGHSNLGIVYTHEHKYEEAIREYRTALKIDPTLLGVDLNLGVVFFREGKYADAAQPLRRFLSSAPGNRQSRELLGLCDVELGKYVEAIQILTPLRAEAQPDVLLALGASYIRLRRMAEAQIVLRRLLDSPESKSAQVHFLMGQTYIGVSKFPQALEEFTAVSTLDPDWPNIQLLLGATEARIGHFQQAGTFLQAQLQKTPHSFATLFTLGALLNKENRFQEAIPLLLKAHDLNSQSGEVAFQLADAYWKTRSECKAWDAVRLAVRLDPKNRHAHYLYAQLARQRGDTATSQNEFAIAESLSKKTSEEDILRFSEESQTH